MTQNLERPGAPAALRPQQRNEDAQSPANRPARPRRRSRSLWFGPMAIAAVAFLIYQLPPYLAMDSSQSRIPLKFPLHYAILVGHACDGNDPPGQAPRNYVDPGSPERSRLLYLLRGEDVPRPMPPDRILPYREVELIARWIEEGAPCD